MSMSLPRKSPKELGISASKVLDFINYLEAHSIEMHSLMLLRHGHVAAEGWWNPYEPELPHMLFSLSKSFTSTAIGLAVQEGKLSVDDPVISFFPNELPAEVSKNLSAMRIKHLLMMGTGHAFDTTSDMHQAPDGNWARAFLALPVEHEPGTHFLYNTGATYMLSAILQKVTGQTLLQFLQPRLFEPLGISNPSWESCPQGINTGGYGLKIRTEDIAKFGQLYLQKGMWQGQRLVNEDWIAEATAKQIANGDGGESDWAQGYGYQFWRCRHGLYRGDGAFGQFCIVMEEWDAVLAMTGGTNDLQGVMNGAWEHLIAAFKSSSDVDKETEAGELDELLQDRLNQLQLEPPCLQQEPQLQWERDANKSDYQLESNPLMLETIQIEFLANTAILQIRAAGTDHRIELGRQRWVHDRTSLFGGEERIVGSFTWNEQGQLLLTIQRIEAPFCITITLEYKGVDNELELQISWNASFEQAAPPAVRGRRL
ncbi:serine hydrolase domain-containing protein [Paenibacillus sanguinis]|uniref:serine hydrolase domain-containing protein n=1 Tax=Paenibacillus sanguinis TaxID=225906 RepID=UPI00037AFD09|nr:serine hydrolase [Paenibacillus sanguinis]